jgi:hypothetical protein
MGAPSTVTDVSDTPSPLVLAEMFSVPCEQINKVPAVTLTAAARKAPNDSIAKTNAKEMVRNAPWRGVTRKFSMLVTQPHRYLLVKDLWHKNSIFPVRCKQLMCRFV